MKEQDFKLGKELIKVLTEIKKAVSGENKENSESNGSFKQSLINVGENCLGFVLFNNGDISELYPINKVFDIFNIENIEDFAEVYDETKAIVGFFVYDEKPVDNYLNADFGIEYYKSNDGMEAFEFAVMSIGFLPNGVEDYVYNETLGGYIPNNLQ
jgi:hypothetical protein